jgi:hypothetical protein
MLPHNYHPHSRYVLKEAPWGYQSADLIHNDISGPVFDLGVDLDDRHGIAFIRVTDIEEMARVLGMATRDEVKVLKARIEDLNAEVLNVPREVESLKDGLSVLVSDFLNRVVPNGDSISVPVEKPTEDHEGESPLSNGDDESVDSGAGETPEQDSDDAGDEGSNELPSDSLNGFGFDLITKSK